MKITVLTLFKEQYSAFLNTSIIKRAIMKGTVEVELVDIRAYSHDKHRHVDDEPYGGGAGMLLQAGPIYEALKAHHQPNSHVILTSPKAYPYNQKKARDLALKEHLIIICGHYEGMDARVELLADEKISIGDYILTGGELPAMVIMDSVIRLLDGAINQASLKDESYDNELLEYPQYTRPEVFMGHKVPEVLLSGNHEAIARYRQKATLKETLKYRPDLLYRRPLSEEEKLLLEEIRQEIRNKR